ncbi:hypothetical protein Back11_16320 [Paenibacillus baekrokdamisoli]|uniref:Uncharacterized protein n=1 Tax=Paenibacillus baekrokdamisoli TaxID=1712516 RepID=A0A3G9IN34_9BACL|nr:hypothetical protein [Paenibacillus baekrokdamisoli]MBB3071982.1 hypothetical protein [Paenibacillus baekrokdamisoli]BBH20287.1 hypothetical protein Back11_16320 [Paenibacillus baekrokdamisoli]
MKKIAIALLLTAVFLTACGKSGGSMDHAMEGGTSGTTESTSTNHNEMGGMDHKGMPAVADKAEAERIQAAFTLSTDKTKPNQDTTITIHLKDKDGMPIEKFDRQHEKLMHFIIVSKDLSFFNHIHPDYKGKGEFTVTTQFPSAGEFELIADIVPTGVGAMSKKKWVTIQGSVPAQQAIIPDTSLTKTVDGKEVTLSFDHLMAGMELNLTFNMKDAQTKDPVTDLEPFLGAVGHVVILNQDAGEYLHVHPLEEKASGPDAKFMATFPHSGIFKIWGQFKQNGKVFTVPFVVKVP